MRHNPVAIAASMGPGTVGDSRLDRSADDAPPCVTGAPPRSTIAALRRYFSKRAPASDIDDLVQEVFLRVQSARRGGPIVNIEAYLMTTARHVLVSRHRNRTARCADLHDALDDVPEPANDLSPERIVAARQDCARALAAVRDLPPRARVAFQLHRFEELSYAAIAERMKISRESVKELLHRAASRVSGSRNGGSQRHARENLSLPSPLSVYRSVSMTGVLVAPPTGASVATHHPRKEPS
jgi:RNA polymerase sigma-70 factor (ECF subfamily)